MRAPARDDTLAALCSLDDAIVVLWADRIRNGPEHSGKRSAVREQVNDLKCAEAPRAGEAETTPDRGIVARCIGRAGVQQNEGDSRRRRTPDAGERVAVRPA